MSSAGGCSAGYKFRQDCFSYWWFRTPFRRSDNINNMADERSRTNLNSKCILFFYFTMCMATLITYPDSKVYGSTWGTPGADRTQMGPMLAPWTLLYRLISTSLKFMRYLVQGLVVICLRTRLDGNMMDILRLHIIVCFVIVSIIL